MRLNDEADPGRPMHFAQAPKTENDERTLERTNQEAKYTKAAKY